jgi:hypothetical protein
VRLVARDSRKVLCSIGAGPHAELLEISGQTFRIYAERHGYDLALRTELAAPERPASWSKVVLVQELLDRYELVFWVDADAAIVDPTADVAAELHRRTQIGLVAHEYDGQVVPNCGVMVVRSRRAARRFLDDVWRRSEYIDHKWWENAAVLDLLGYDLEPQVALRRPAPMLRKVQFIDRSWNSVLVDEAAQPRIRHYPGRSHEYRLEHLARDLAAARAVAPA